MCRHTFSFLCQSGLFIEYMDFVKKAIIILVILNRMMILFFELFFCKIYAMINTSVYIMV